ncbi:MAG: nucleotidyltransferase domain-containing protein [Candidatus Bathyarchaeia archaeon]
MRRKSSPSVRVFYPRFSREALIEAIRRSIPALMGKLPLLSVILFGSYAKGRHTAASDVDLLVIYDGPRRPNAYEIVVESLRIPRLEPLVYSRWEFERLAERDPPFARALLRDGLAIYGELSLPQSLRTKSAS